MVSFVSTLVFVAAAFGVAQGYSEIEAKLALALANALPEGAYYRPPSSLTSGAVNSTAPFRRSPCPAMNTLANHGYLPRDGKNITVDQALAVVMDKFNIAEDLASVMGGLSPDLFDLNDLSKHNDKIEHDASLARSDAYFGADPAFVTPNLIADVLAHGLDGEIDVTDVAKIRAARVKFGEAHNVDFYGSTIRDVVMAYMPSLFVRRIYVAKAVGTASIIPLISLLANSHVWVMYGYMCKTWFPSFPSFLVGDIAAVCYLSVYWWYAPDRRRVARTLGVVLLVLAVPSTYVIVGGLGYTNQTRADVGETEGYFCSATVVCLHFFMLKNLINVVKTRSAATLNLRLLLIGTANTCGWFTYGVVTDNWIISGPHVFVMALHASALVLYVAFRPRPSATVESTDNDAVRISVELSPKPGVAKNAKAAIALPSPEYHTLPSPMQPPLHKSFV